LVFEGPGIGVAGPGPVFGWGFAAEEGGETEPDDAGRWRAGTGIGFLSGRDFQLPAFGVGLSDDDREGWFAELEVNGVIDVGCEEELAGEFRGLGISAPDGLAFEEDPMGIFEVDRREGGD